MPEKRRVPAWILFFGAAVLAGLLDEGLCRLILPKDYRIGFLTERSTEDRPRFTAGRPTVRQSDGITYHFDADGFRLSGSDGDPDGTVLFIGDSITLGFLVKDEETLVAAAQRRLRERGLRVRCLNAGATGIGAAAELRLLRWLLARHRVSAVVEEVYPANDLTDNWQDGGFAVEDGALVEKDPPLTPPLMRLRGLLLGNGLTRRSKMLMLLANTFFNGVTFLPRVDDGMVELERRLLGETARTVSQKRIPLLLVVVPSPAEAGVRPVPHWRETPNDGDPAVYDQVAALVRGLGVPALDLQSTLVRPEHYVAGDTHLSPFGNEAAGRAIADRLMSLLPRR
jgi:lysophospholipase L1-like esterase